MLSLGHKNFSPVFSNVSVSTAMPDVYDWIWPEEFPSCSQKVYDFLTFSYPEQHPVCLKALHSKSWGNSSSSLCELISPFVAVVQVVPTFLSNTETICCSSIHLWTSEVIFVASVVYTQYHFSKL
jgi:hypothetical protein